MDRPGAASPGLCQWGWGLTRCSALAAGPLQQLLSGGTRTVPGIRRMEKRCKVGPGCPQVPAAPVIFLWKFIHPVGKQFVLLPMLWGKVPGLCPSSRACDFPCEKWRRRCRPPLPLGCEAVAGLFAGSGAGGRALRSAWAAGAPCCPPGRVARGARAAWAPSRWRCSPGVSAACPGRQPSGSFRAGQPVAAALHPSIPAGERRIWQRLRSLRTPVPCPGVAGKEKLRSHPTSSPPWDRGEDRGLLPGAETFTIAFGLKSSPRRRFAEGRRAKRGAVPGLTAELCSGLHGASKHVRCWGPAWQQRQPVMPPREWSQPSSAQ